MRYIRKGQEPKSLIQHRLSPMATYANLPQNVKEELKERLAREQGFLCCYCMRRITLEAHGMKLEHWLSQSDSEEAQLTWKNLLGACMGGEGRPQQDQHCDTRKGNTPLTVNPTEERCERVLHFLSDGKIESTDPAIQHDIDQTLNLNHSILKNNRKATLAAFVDAMTRKHRGSWSEAALQQELERLQQPDSSGMLQEYCQVPIFWLKKRMGLLGRVSSS